MKVVCDICGTYIEKKGLLRHKLSVHEKRRDFVCTICGMGFPVKYKLEYHMVKHSEVRNFQCAVCQKPFKTRSDMLQHEKKHSGKNIFRCPECIAFFDSRVHLDFHLRESHCRGPREIGAIVSLDCPICKKQFSRKEHVRRHLKSIHEVRKESTEQLTFSYNLPQGLKTEGQDMLLFTCLRCNSRCLKLDDLKQHFDSIHDKDEPIAICEICQPNRNFKRREHLRRHMLTVHQRHKIFPCEICPSAFKSLLDLKNHYKDDHYNSNSHFCKICLKAFTSVHGMREHQSAVHENIRKFVCDFPGCSQTFVKPSRLKYHYERVHSDKKIICDKCGLVCSSKNEVRYHLWSHLKLKGKQKRYECKICFKKYYLKSSYKRHKLNVHKKSDESLVENLERYEHFIPEVKIEIKQEMEDFENLPIKEEEDEFQDYCSDVEATDSIKNPSGAEFDQIFLRDPEKSKSDDSEIREKPEIVKQKAKFHRKSTGRKTENPKKFCCEHCTKIYSTWRGLKLHTRQYHGIELPPRVVEPDRKIIKLTSPPICDYCGDQLKTKATLIIHFRKHVKNLAPEFCCQFCGKVFNHFSSFQLHRKGHTKEYTKQCPHCTQKFLTNQTLKWHVDYHHMNKPAIPKEICQVCGKAVQKFYMKIHLKTHSSEFKCSVCGRSCITEESLKSHYMQHTKNRPFSCVYCDKSYTFQKNLKFHIRKFHSDIPGIEDFIASFNKRNFL